MKRLICILLFLLLFPVFSFADLPDISNLSYDELLRLRQDLNLFIWTSKEWKHVEVPTGIYVIGVPTVIHPNFRITIYHIAI